MSASKAFYRLNPVKQQQIMNAAYQEFTQHDYDYASTNLIAKNAKISKGTLFNYFTSKRKLFIFIFKQAVKRMNDTYFAEVNYEETDFFQRLIAFSDLKAYYYGENRSAFDFLAHVFLNLQTYAKVYPAVTEENIKYEQQIIKVLTQNIDLTKFREDIVSQKALKLIYWSIEGYRTELEHKFQADDFSQWTEVDAARLYTEYEGYLQTLRRVYYKEAFLEEENDDEHH